jgi:hypothetical protein
MFDLPHHTSSVPEGLTFEVGFCQVPVGDSSWRSSHGRECVSEWYARYPFAERVNPAFGFTYNIVLFSLVV